MMKTRRKVYAMFALVLMSVSVLFAGCGMDDEKTGNHSTTNQDDREQNDDDLINDATMNGDRNDSLNEPGR